MLANSGRLRIRITSLALATVCTSAYAEAIVVEEVLLQAVDECELAAQEKGVVAEVLTDKGTVLAEGQTIAKLIDDDARNRRDHRAVELAIAKKKAANDVDVRLAKKSYAVAAAELARAMEANRLHPGTNPASKIDELRLKADEKRLLIEQAELDLRQAEDEVRLHELLLKGAEFELRRRAIVSPFAGTIVDIYVRRGESVDAGTSIARVVNASRLQAELFIEAKHVHNRLLDTRVSVDVVRDDESNLRGTATIDFVSLEIDPVDQLVLVRITIENADGRFKPGMKSRVIVPAVDWREDSTTN